MSAIYLSSYSLFLVWCGILPRFRHLLNHFNVLFTLESFNLDLWWYSWPILWPDGGISWCLSRKRYASVAWAHAQFLSQLFKVGGDCPDKNYLVSKSTVHSKQYFQDSLVLFWNRNNRNFWTRPSFFFVLYDMFYRSNMLYIKIIVHLYTKTTFIVFGRFCRSWLLQRRNVSTLVSIESRRLIVSTIDRFGHWFGNVFVGSVSW